MAIVKVGGGLTGIRGSIGGTTFSISRAGAIAKSRGKQINPNTNKQGQSRSILSDIVKRWQTDLTDAERADWNLFALANPSVNVFGETTYLSGSNWYAKLNAVLLQLGSALINTPPVSTTITSLTTFSLTATSGGTPSVGFTVTPGTLGANEEIQCWVSYPASPGRFYANSILRLLGTNTGGSFDVGPASLAYFGTWPVAPGNKMFAMAAVVNTANGLTSPGIMASAILT